MNRAVTGFAAHFKLFSGLRIVREQIIADGNFFAARTRFSGDFSAVFTYSPIGPVEPTGEHIEWEVTAPSGTTMTVDWPKSGCKPTTAAS